MTIDIHGVKVDGFMMSNGSIWTIVAIDDKNMFILPYQETFAMPPTVIFSACAGTSPNLKWFRDIAGITGINEEA